MIKHMSQKITFWIATKITQVERRDFLYLCIKSIINQSNPNWEIIISDDASTLEINYNQFLHDDRIKLYNQKESLWIFKNFNFCLSKTDTEWFIPMWDDDIIHPEFVWEILDQAEKNESIDVIYFDHENIDSRWHVFQISKNQYKVGIIHDKGWDANIDSLLWHSPASFFSAIKSRSLLEIWWYPDYWMTTDGYIGFLYFINFRGFYISKKIAQLRRHRHNASWSRSVITFMSERISLIDAILKDFWDRLSADWIKNLNQQKKNIQNSHINIMREFKEKWRLLWMIFAYKCCRNWYFWIRSTVIIFLWLVLWKKLQLWFNCISDIYQYIESRIFPLFIK